MSEENKNKSSEEVNNKSDKKDGFQMNLDFLKKNLVHIIGGAVIIALVIALAVVVVEKDDESYSAEELSKEKMEEIEEKLLDVFEERKMFDEEAKIKFDKIVEEADLYKVNITVNDEKIDVYSSNDYSSVRLFRGEEVSEKVIKKVGETLDLEGAFIKSFVPQSEKVVLDEVREDDIWYNVYLTIDDQQEIEVHLTKDFVIFIPQSIDLEILYKDYEPIDPDIDLSVENKKALGVKDNSKPQLDYFVMSFCPYGNPADENASKIQAAFGDSVEVVPHYIVGLDEKAPNGYNSLHGPQEAHQDIRELCVLKNYGKDKFFEFTLASNDKLTYENADSKWNDVARSVGVDVNVVAECEKNGLEIAKQEIGISKNAKVQNMKSGEITSIVSSPTVMVNGEKVVSSASAIQKALCESFNEGEKPAACEQDIESAEAASGSCN